MGNLPGVLVVVLTVVAWACAALAFIARRRPTRARAEGIAQRGRIPAWAGIMERIVWGGLWITFAMTLFRGLLQIHRAIRGPAMIHPDDVAAAMMAMGAFVATLIPAMLAANLVSWLVPPMRRANQGAAIGLATQSYLRASLGLVRMGLVVIPVALAQGLLGAFEPWSR
ncbi:MAG: hypothetical protein JWP35_3343 [Caulobacter sp.]|nr:hypothetical protein [Caulobacter sp.]